MSTETCTAIEDGEHLHYPFGWDDDCPTCKYEMQAYGADDPDRTQAEIDLGYAPRREYEVNDDE